jgi:hypothetical protein
MEVLTKVILSKEKSMVKEFIKIVMEINTKANGKMARKTEMEHINMLMIIYIQESGKTIEHMVEDSITLILVNMMDNGLMVICMDMEYWNTLMETYMKANGETI